MGRTHNRGDGVGWGGVVVVVVGGGLGGVGEGWEWRKALGFAFRACTACNVPTLTTNKCL